MVTIGRRMENFVSDNGGGRRGDVIKSFIVVAGSLICISFGTMLGWPSHTYPLLLLEDAPIVVNLDETAMIAGMLMTGFVVSTPFAGFQCVTSRTGVRIGILFIILGWLLLYTTSDVLGLCLSRLSIGLGAGYSMRKFKFYTQEIFQPNTYNKIQSSFPLFICVGVTLSFSIGPFCPFRLFPILAAVVPTLGFFIFLFVPQSLLSLYKEKNITKVSKIIEKLHGRQYVEKGLENIENIVNSNHYNILQIFQIKHSRNTLLKLLFLATVQQFSGGPALIVYSQIIFIKINHNLPVISAFIYSILFFIATYFSVTFTHKFKRKLTLFISCLGTGLTSFILVVYFYFKPEEIYFSVIALLSMAFYVLFHTSGLTIVPSLVSNDLLNEDFKYNINCVIIMYTYELAVIVTKICQVLFTVYDMYISFSLFSTVAFSGMLLILCFFKETKLVSPTENLQ